jgi:predicted methyltransferase
VAASIAVLTLADSFPAQAQQAAEAQTTRLIEAAIASEIRPPADRARDGNRKPLETLLFFGLRPDMRVLELVPAGGWYTKILAPVLQERGALYLALGPLDQVRELARAHEELSAIEVLDGASHITFRGPAAPETLTDTSFGVTGLDLVLTFRNVHNYAPEMRVLLHKAAFEALRPGGVYGVVDHTRRHMAPNRRELNRRVDPVQAIKEIQAAGFVLEDYSTIHYSPADALDLEVGDPAVSNQTDRFTLRFRKP